MSTRSITFLSYLCMTQGDALKLSMVYEMKQRNRHSNGRHLKAPYSAQPKIGSDKVSRANCLLVSPPLTMLVVSSVKILILEVILGF